MSGPRLAILGSGQGTNFVALQEAIQAGQLDAEIVLVASDKPDAPILARAAAFGLPTATLVPSPFKTKLSPEGELALVDLLQKHGAEWVILAGYMRVVKEPLLRAFPNRIINIHPFVPGNRRSPPARTKPAAPSTTSTNRSTAAPSSRRNASSYCPPIRPNHSTPASRSRSTGFSPPRCNTCLRQRPRNKWQRSTSFPSCTWERPLIPRKLHLRHFTPLQSHSTRPLSNFADEPHPISV
jgi:hypothetical protein